MYYESLADNSLKDVCHKSYERPTRGIDIKPKSRSWFHWFARVLYKNMRSFYVSIVFYFMPFTVLVINRFMAELSTEGEGGEGAAKVVKPVGE